ncbi:TonB-dependent receptor domain-containing protein, partial [Pseudomonas viridiflava]|uniref:TonB-dependent receptor domain-containing protein n=1 Tax=Pseudomonas viridiflava TaxID=33069 RepID=UPI001F11D0CF
DEALKGTRTGVLVVHQCSGSNEYGKRRPRYLPALGYSTMTIEMYGDTSYLRRLEQTGVYLQDLIEMDKWRFSLGLRQDWVETSDENRIAEAGRPVGTEINDRRTKLTGRAGALY